MITAQVEGFMEQLEELKPLLPLHYEELALDKDKVPLMPRWDVYAAREAAGELCFVTVREDGRLIGYFIGFVMPGLHYATCLTCQMDIFYIHPDHRGRSCGLRLFRTVEKELRRRGVQRWFVGSKLHRDSGRLFTALGFGPVETYYSKWLGD